MNNKLTEIICVVDRSGSMQSIKADAIGGFNSFIESQKAGDGRANLTLVLFDHEYLVVHDNVPLARVKPLDERTFVPRGNTALLDALGLALAQVEKRHGRTSKRERPDATIVCILTDGMENASCKFTRSDIVDRISHQQSEHGWEFIFLAANQDAIAEGMSLGIRCENSVGFTADAAGICDALSELDNIAHCIRSR